LMKESVDWKNSINRRKEFIYGIKIGKSRTGIR